MTAPVVDPDTLVDRYAAWIAAGAAPGGEHVYAWGLIEALTELQARHSNAARLQRIRAVQLAADRVHAERAEPRWVVSDRKQEAR